MSNLTTAQRLDDLTRQGFVIFPPDEIDSRYRVIRLCYVTFLESTDEESAITEAWSKISEILNRFLRVDKPQ